MAVWMALPGALKAINSPGMPEERGPNTQYIHHSLAPSDSIHPTPKSFGITIYVAASKQLAKPTGCPVQRHELFHR